MNDLALIEQARAALARVRSVEDAKDVRDKSEALARYLKRKEGSQEAARYATEIRLRAERRIGQLLSERGEQRGKAGRSRPGRLLPDGLSRDESSKFQRIATLPAPVFERALQVPEPTTKALLKEVARQRATAAPEAEAAQRTCTVEDLSRLAADGRRFGTIYADPPWAYGNQATRAATDNHYGTMSVADIAALPVAQLAAEDAHLHLWTTNGFLFESRAIIEAWGFEYRSCYVWVKPSLGIGNYWRVSHEFLLFGIRGSAPFRSRSLRSWGEHRRAGHSRKPEAVRLLVEQASPAPRLELFGRRAADGWTVWGNEVERDLLSAPEAIR